MERERRESGGQFPTEKQIDARLEYQRETNKKRGGLTWTLFYWQIGTFGVGVVFLVGAFLVSRFPVI